VALSSITWLSQASRGPPKHHVALPSTRGPPKHTWPSQAPRGPPKHHVAPQAPRGPPKHHVASQAPRGPPKHHVALPSTTCQFQRAVKASSGRWSAHCTYHGRCLTSLTTLGWPASAIVCVGSVRHCSAQSAFPKHQAFGEECTSERTTN
jgi:hypothetical protein